MSTQHSKLTSLVLWQTPLRKFRWLISGLWRLWPCMISIKHCIAIMAPFGLTLFDYVLMVEVK